MPEEGSWYALLRLSGMILPHSYMLPACMSMVVGGLQVGKSLREVMVKLGVHRGRPSATTTLSADHDGGPEEEGGQKGDVVLELCSESALWWLARSEAVFRVGRAGRRRRTGVRE